MKGDLHWTFLKICSRTYSEGESAGMGAASVMAVQDIMAVRATTGDGDTRLTVTVHL